MTEMIISGFVSKVVNDCGDILKNKIRNADVNRKSSEQNIESRIYQVTIDAINVFTFNTYKGQEKLYDAAESILREFKNKKENIDAVKTGLKMLDAQITDDRCADFLGKLCDEICEDKNGVLYKEIILIQNRQIIKDVHEGFNKNEQNQKDIREDIHEGFERSEQNHQETQRKLDYLVEKTGNKEVNFYSETIENRAEEYAAKWDKNVFLNDFKKRDKNAGVNIKLKEIYLEEQLPHYTWKTNNEPLSDLKELLREYTVDNDGKNMLLILGLAGIGKSTLITWIMANLIENTDNIFVYQFASDLKNIDWQGDNLLGYIFQILKLKYDELENKVLILDGFDEIYANNDTGIILNKLNQELSRINILKNFSLIITCRENYVSELEKIECDYIILQTWDSNQIKGFCEVYGKESGSDISEIKINKLLEYGNVFGIPLILYMVLALDITIEKSESLVDVYDQIFSIDRSSIYDRCIRNSRYGGEHRISEDKIKQAIHQISQRIAFWIFENNSDKAFIPQKEYEDICNIVIKEISNGNEDIRRDVLIGNYFKYTKHCEGIGTEELQFVHRSIYEYFVVVYFFESIYNLTSIEELAGRLGELLKDRHLSEQILEFIKYKFDKINGHNLCDITREVFNKMLQDGMTYHMKEKCKNVIIREMNIFANMLKVVHLWNPKLGELDNKLVFYLQYNHMADLNLREINLSEAILSKANLSGADLSKADLSKADLSEANLSEANLSEADLGEADLGEADLSEADLSGADLSEANLGGTDLSGANLSGANLSGADLSEADLRRTNLSKAYLIETDLIGEILSGANLSEADLSGANLRGANLIETDLSGANLRGANLRGANLSEINLSGANLSKTDLSSVNLIRVDLSRAYLSEVDLRGAYLSGIDLRGAYLSGVNLIGVDLSAANLNETIFDEKQIDLLYGEYDLSKSKIFISDVIISYKDYCSRKQNG